MRRISPSMESERAARFTDFKHREILRARLERDRQSSDKKFISLFGEI